VIPHCNIYLSVYAIVDMTPKKRIGTGCLSGIKKLGLHLILLTLFVALLASCNPVEPVKELSLGDIAPDFAIKDLDGNVIVLSSLRGRPVVLRFFETDCRFCKADTPAFVNFYKKNGEENLTIIYIGSFYESEQSLAEFAAELGVVFPVVMDKGGRLANLYNILAYPQTLFLGPEGEILAAILGGVGEAELEEIIAPFQLN